MANITDKQKEMISEIYSFCIVSTDITHKLSFLGDFYSIIRAALLRNGKYDKYSLALKLVKSDLKNAWATMGDQRNWPAAGQTAIDINERLVEIGINENLIDKIRIDFNASSLFSSPEQSNDEEDN